MLIPHVWFVLPSHIHHSLTSLWKLLDYVKPKHIPKKKICVLGGGAAAPPTLALDVSLRPPYLSVF